MEILVGIREVVLEVTSRLVVFGPSYPLADTISEDIFFINNHVSQIYNLFW